MMEPRWHISLETSYQPQTFEHKMFNNIAIYDG